MKKVNQESANKRLIHAAAKGDTDALNKALSDGADLNATSMSGATPMMVAARDGHVNCVRQLIEKGANVNARREHDGMTSLMIAALRDHAFCVKALVDAGAVIDTEKDNGKTALELASDSDCIRILAEAGANIECLRKYPPEYKIALSVVEKYRLSDQVDCSVGDKSDNGFGL